MHVFYDPQFDFSEPGEQAVLNSEESHHCVKVLRLGKGAKVNIVNGRGGFFTGELINADARGTVLKLLTVSNGIRQRNHYLHVAVAPTKNIERIEWFLEKATEIGIDEITPVICERSERKEVKTERLSKVLVAAMKQSQQTWLPKLNEPVSLPKLEVNDAHAKFIAHCGGGPKRLISELAVRGSGYTVLIGPEGDFTESELLAAIGKGFQPVSLGESRLRTETAALAACFELNYFNR